MYYLTMCAGSIVFSVIAIQEILNLHLYNLNHYDDQLYTALWDELPLKLCLQIQFSSSTVLCQVKRLFTADPDSWSEEIK